MSEKNPISLVELHRHDRQKPVFFQGGSILAFQWTSSVTPPHGTATVTIAAPVTRFSVAMPGDWLIVRSMSGTTVFFGYVVDVSDGISIGANNAVVSDPLVIQAESWLDMLSRVELYSPPTNSYDKSVGTFFTVDDYVTLVEKYLGDFVFGNLGEAVATIFKRTALVELPESLAGGGLLSDLIPVVYDKTTQVNHTPDLMIEELPTAGAFPTHIGYTSVHSNVYPLLRTLFVPEPALIEMFPHLSPLSKEGERTVLAIIDAGESTFNETTGTAPYDRGVGDELLIPSDRLSTRKASSLADYLKARPALVYRVKPWRIRPLRQSVFSAVNAGNYKSTERLVDGEDSSDPAASGLASQEILANTFDEITWNKDLFARVPAGRTVSIQRTRSDSNRVNCTFINLGITEVNVIQASGLPVIIDSEVERHGLRTANPTWPFIITPDDQAKARDFILYMRSIAAQIMQFYHRGHAFGSGTMNIAGAEQIARFDYNEDTGKFSWPLQAGRPFTVALPGDDFSGYVESVSVVVSIEGTTVAGGTEVRYSRGLFGEDEDRFRHSPIPLRPAPKIGGSSATAKQTAAAARDPFADCRQGRPATDRTFSLAGRLDPYALEHKPDWLGNWVLARTTNPTASKARFTSTLPAFPATSAPQQSAILQQDVVWFTAACAYVLERYWKMIYPDARVRVTSWVRPNDGVHDSGQAMDFAVVKNCWRMSWNGTTDGRATGASITAPISMRVDRPDMADTQGRSSTPTAGVRTIRIGSDPGQSDFVVTAPGIDPLHATIVYDAAAGTLRVYDYSSPGSGTAFISNGVPSLADSSGLIKGTSQKAFMRFSSDLLLGLPNGSGTLSLTFSEDKGLVNALQLWASYGMLAAAGRIPKGGRGLYLNVNPYQGIRGISPNQAGLPSAPTVSGPGGSAAPHYDIRGAFGVPGSSQYWAHFDWTGDGLDEVEVDTPSRTGVGPAKATQGEAWLVVADVANTFRARYFGKSFVENMYVKPAAMGPADSGAKFSRDQFRANIANEIGRVALRDALKSYFDDVNSAVGNRNASAINLIDTNLPVPDGSVPNVMQVLGYEASCFYTPVTPNPGNGSVPQTAITQQQDLGKFNAATAFPTPFDNARAPFLEIYGGDDRGPRESGQYMYDYFSPPQISLKNNTFVAKNSRVDGPTATAWAESQLSSTPPVRKILFVYSTGGNVVYSFLKGKVAQYDKIYLVDVDLRTTQAAALFKDIVAQNAAKCVYIYSFDATDAVSIITRPILISTPGLESKAAPSSNAAPQVAIDHLKTAGLINY